ncbi:ComF family protein [Paenibacillus sp. SYP-B3998]|uniref:ComF family protein n=1 Tax=Paenibacillus sp. SYP-B3998 TaxID=2678564 RepID=A0A6G4A3J2_9BACL|nr:ComF family protein [Paenibacillus sp. SYP-B3998]NEW08858.1 ComF family protein [Paenibacillus sp. SYP-B3998]
MKEHKKKSGKWKERIAEAIFSLLSPQKDTCMLCKQQSHLHSSELGLCCACFRRIPWIVEVLCPSCGRGENCQDCVRRKETYFAGNRSAVKYDDTMKELLARYKYRGDERLKSVLGHMLVHAYRLLRADAGRNRMGIAYELITYVPVSERRLKERGFNQAEQMAAELGRRMGIAVVPLLLRSKHTDKQSFKTRNERLADLHQVFEISPVHVEQVKQLNNAHLIIYIIDDVYTTGSTMNQCAKVLKESLKAEVFGITWAR